jgi:type II pantothenate kinase
MGAPFCKLADAATYVACPHDLSRDAAGRAHWVEFFKRHFRTIVALGVDAALARGESRESAEARADAAMRDVDEQFDRFAAVPDQFGRVTIMTMDHWRDTALQRHGFADAFVDVKRRENEKMLPLLPALCRELDALRGAEQIKAMIEGIFAGNIFDLGADATAKAFFSESPPVFLEVRRTLKRRPWLVDDYEVLEKRLLSVPQRKCVYFIDNAGSDFLLGALPVMRWLAQRGTRVVLAANERPTLNDMTIHDIQQWWPRILQAEPSLKDLPIQLVSTGTGEPMIDLSDVSDELNAASEDADFIVLEGMGRGVESNLDARFSCDALNIAMVKDQTVARYIGGEVFDLVCRFR